MNLLVTGGSGFIGSHLVEALVGKGHSVRCLVRKTSNVDFLNEMGVELVSGDITEKESLKHCFKDVDVVYHLASIRGEKKIPREMYWNVNVTGTKNVMESAYDSGVKKFLFCSSIGVLGWIDKLPGNENFPYNPQGNYHITKCEAEKRVSKFSYEKKFQTVVIRPVMSYGLRDLDGMLFNLTRLITDKRFLIIGNGKNYMHLVNVKNLVKGFILAMEKESASGTYIIADKEPITVNELVTIVSETIGANVPSIHIPLNFAKIAGYIMEKTYTIIPTKSEPFITPYKIDLMSKSRYYDITKAINELEYVPEMSTPDGIVETVRWYTENGHV
ncbi:MAG: NAD-dependent epimerase/dehydratase family protein [Candidatus Altiarchaeota archaeon]